jgi:outer membrane protein assembly factor BamE (lipoprotein component of BamABCDE complex)
MMNLKTYLTPLLTIITLLILSGCQTLEVRGQFVSDKAVAEINNKKPSKKEVSSLVGTPTYVPDYTDNTWYYIQRSLSKRAWFEAKVITQRVVKITFNDNNKVIEAALLADMQNENITTHNHYTKTHGTEQSGVQKFVKNIGRFNKTTDGSNRRKKKK